MKVRRAKITDAENIQALISQYAELDRMLSRSLADVYENIQAFVVAEDEAGVIVGCCALQVIWSDLAEIKSLAVAVNNTGKGIGRALVQAAIKVAKEIGIRELFTLTLEPAFFEKMSFQRVSREQLPMKVWSDCAKCSKQDNCDEVALIYKIK